MAFMSINNLLDSMPELHPFAALTNGYICLTNQEIENLLKDDKLDKKIIQSSFAHQLTAPLSDSAQIANLQENLYAWIFYADDCYEIAHAIYKHCQQEKSLNHFIQNVIVYGQSDRMNHDILEFMISLICEIGIKFMTSERKSPKALTCFLLSVSNHSSNTTRLNLINYFCKYAELTGSKDFLIKIINRFGSTALSFSFEELFSSASDEGLQLQFLLEHLPALLLLPQSEQLHLAEVFKFATLKEPEQFIGFTKLLCKKIARIKDPLFQLNNILHAHLHQLLQIACSINHKYLVSELLTIIEENIGIEAKNISVDYLIDKGVYKGRLFKLLKEARRKGAVSINYFKIKESKQLKVAFNRKRSKKAPSPLALWEEQHRMSA